MTSNGKFDTADRQNSDSSGEPRTVDSGKGSSEDVPRMSLKDAVLTKDQQKLKELDDEEYCDYTQ